jgi:CubicO group peptidase (beta-lactamase class C family)
VRDRKLLHVSLAGFLALALVQAGCTKSAEKPTAEPTAAVEKDAGKTVPVTGGNTWPTKDWQVSTPEQKNVNSANLVKMKEYLETARKHVRSVVVVRGGDIIFEYYRAGTAPVNPNELQAVPAIAQTVTSTLVGMAISNKSLEGIDQKIGPFFSEYPKKDPQFDQIALKDLLTMTAGFRWGERYELAEWQKSPNLMQTSVARLIEFPPGQNFVYDTASIHLLSKVMSKATGMSLEKYAAANLFQPLGITEWKWETDAQGYTTAGHGLQLKTRDMAKIGYLYLRKGMWDGKQLIPADWVQTATQQQSRGLPEIANYGYLWWVTTARTHEAYFSWNYNRHYLFIVPDLDLLVAATADEGYERGSGDTGIVGAFIVPAIK